MPLLSNEEIEGRLSEVEGWAREGDALKRELTFKDFVASVEFVKGLVPQAEEMNHHPDVAISWNKVTLTLSTHSEGGITENDFELASRIDSLA
jgi:4a-hydroxytetrahydrobiopterin dehydratase